jgi:acetyl-CoA carboxylase biotin carboxyl carrier protein
MTVDIAKLRSLLDLLEERNIAEFEHEAEGTRVKVVRAHAGTFTVQAPAMPSLAAAVAVPSGAPGAGSLAPGAADPDSVDVTSLFVGTFYRSPSPDAPPFVEVGSVIRPGQTLCIIEAMKLMNDIEAEISGTVVEIYAQNGKPVDFGQKLFRIKKA